MEKSRLESQLKSYDRWKSEIIRTIDEYRSWLLKYRLATDDSEKRIEECLASLHSDRLTVAFVAEFSRGKTELINAMFFSNYGRRLLPSTAGRTTMCPTEMFYDHRANQSYVRLLPIETRLQDTPVRDLKKKPALWVTYPLDMDSLDQVEACMREVIETRRVSLEEALRLGMYDPQLHPHLRTPPAFVDIPKWRHAMISFPHPLLKQGLAILDTPGLNALGSEPELTLNMLPSAQAVLFVLAADAGVTRSDLEMWQNHIKGFQSSRQRGLMVVLNKIDTLWDELKDEASITEAINQQCQKTAKILNVRRDVIFPVSAHKGLLGKIKGDQALLARSALQQLEQYLSNDILNARQEIVQDTVTSEISQMVENTRGIVTAKLNEIKKQLNEFRQLSGKSQEAIEQLMIEARSEQTEYSHNINSFKASKKALKKQAKNLLGALDLKKLEQTIDTTHSKMSDNWTTVGMKINMRKLFDQMRNDMQIVVKQSEQSRKLIRSIYRRFQSDHGLSVVQPKMFSVMRYRVELELLYQEAEIFRKSPVTTMTEKHFVMRRFFVAMVSRAMELFSQARYEASIWLKTALEPLVFQIREHKGLMQQRLNNLQKVSQSRDTLDSRITELEHQHNAIAKQLTILRNMHNTLNSNLPFGERERTRPRLVKSSMAS